MELFGAIITELPDENSKKLTDMESVRMRINTADEIPPSHWERDNEHYAAYVIADPEIQKKTDMVSFKQPPALISESPHPCAKKIALVRH